MLFITLGMLFIVKEIIQLKKYKVNIFFEKCPKIIDICPEKKYNIVG